MAIPRPENPAPTIRTSSGLAASNLLQMLVTDLGTQGQRLNHTHFLKSSSS